MNKIMIIAGFGAAALYAEKKGYLGEYLDQIKVSASEFWQGLSGDQTGDQSTNDPQGVTNVVTDSSGAISPVVVTTSGGITDTAEANPFVKMLRENEYDLNPWATQNLYWVAAICNQENRGRNPTARGSAGELGVMQVKPSTAADLVRWGYTKYPATAETLTTVNGGLYFGTAYLDYLSKKNSDRDWITKAYNGGPGFASLSADYIRAREAYLQGVERKYLAIRGVVERPTQRARPDLILQPVSDVPAVIPQPVEFPANIFTGATGVTSSGIFGVITAPQPSSGTTPYSSDNPAP